mmetsp:Transcript_17128/g.22231  ORF Transcript_17128/g.22231 Transcript_17128/m.22231 type:complete len:153 (+) Transcript_17128:75-533(+)
MVKLGAIILGFGGLIPFVGLSKPGQRFINHEFWLEPLRKAIRRPSLNATEIQVTYGVVILSFLGGPHWGFSFANRRHNYLQLLWGVTPPLIAWPAASIPAPASLDWISFGLGSSLLVDTIFSRLRCIPLSYLLLRTPLTLIATLSLQSNKQV